MKRLLKYFLAALVVITGVFSQTADAKAFSYTYTVSFSAGGQGSINGGVQVRKASGNEASASVSAKGDKIIVTGSLGDHGMSLMSFREGFGFETDLKSDTAPMWNVVKKALDVGGVTAMKDPTRGGFANAINEMASKSGKGVLLHQEAIPIKKEVHAVSEMLGIDPFEVANEGKVVMGVKADKAEEVLEAIKTEEYGKDAAIIGEVIEGDYVVVETPIGGERILEAPIADPVPRVC